MSRRALVEHRPWLLVGLLAALAFYFLSDEKVGGLYLIALKGCSVAALAIYALVRCRSRHGYLIAAVMAFGAAGDVGMELDDTWGGGLFLVAHLIAIVFYRLNPRKTMAPSQWAAALALLVAVPLLAWMLTASTAATLYAVGLGAMASTAWASRFTRYRVGLGALLFVASDLLIFARIGGRLSTELTEWFVWPLYYAGQFLICTGVIQRLRRERLARQPQ